MTTRRSCAPAAAGSDGGEVEKQLCRRRRWRSEGYHHEAKTWHGLARAVRRGLQNMRIQSFLTAAAINPKRLAAAFRPRACAPYRARAKGKDERGVGYVKRNAVAGRRIETWSAFVTHLEQWTRKIAAAHPDSIGAPEA